MRKRLVDTRLKKSYHAETMQGNFCGRFLFNRTLEINSRPASLVKMPAPKRFTCNINIIIINNCYNDIIIPKADSAASFLYVLRILKIACRAFVVESVFRKVPQTYALCNYAEKYSRSMLCF